MVKSAIASLSSPLSCDLIISSPYDSHVLPFPTCKMGSHYRKPSRDEKALRDSDHHS